jgi:predicted acetyltransferase
MDWMLRLVDVARALESRGYPPGVTARVDIEVRDGTVKQNARPITLEVDGGLARVSRAGHARVHADVRALASLYSGYMSASDLACAGLIEGPDRDLASLSAIFAGPAPWMPDMF